MNRTRVAHRYAQALMEISEEQNAVEQVTADLALIDATLKASRDLRLLLASPVVREGKKNAVFQELWGSRLHRSTMVFLLLLTKKQREPVLPDVIEEFAVLHDRKLGVVRAEVSTAVPISAAQETELGAGLSRSTGKTVRLRTSVDPSIRGGVVVRIGDRVVDASVRRNLERLRERFLEGGSPTTTTA